MTQAGWFRYSLARISGYGTWRAVTLQRIFFVTLLVAAFKAWLLLGGPYSLAWLKPWATLAILVMIGLSVAISALYLNQNNRSLSHRYSAQIRSIDDWLVRHSALLSSISTSYDQTVAKTLPEGSDQRVSDNPGAVELETGRALRIDDEAKADLIAQMLIFEDLMAEELLDFLSISEHDALEISAA